jgi:RNA 2',3'-cyclic 3'-phosphodiesterase
VQTPKPGSGAQLSLLDSFDSIVPTQRTATIDNFFLAIQPGAAAASSIIAMAQGVCRQYQLRGRPFDAARLHVSLLNLSHLHESLPKLIEFADKVASLLTIAPFGVRFARVVSFSGNSQVPRTHPIVLLGGDTQGVERLLRAQVDAMKAISVGTKPRRFVPHMTLLYDNKNVPEHTVAPISWTVDEYVLIQSHVGQHRPYSVLGRWPLGNSWSVS